MLGELSWGHRPSCNTQVFIRVGFDSLADPVKAKNTKLQKSRGLFFLRSSKRRRQQPHRHTLLRDPKTIPNPTKHMKKRRTTQGAYSKIPGRAFSEVGEAPQAAATQTQPAGRADPETLHFVSN